MFRRRRDRDRDRGTRHSLFDVFSIVSGDAPKILRDACSVQMSFPSFFPYHPDDDNRDKRAAINAYLDMIKIRLSGEHQIKT